MPFAPTHSIPRGLHCLLKAPQDVPVRDPVPWREPPVPHAAALPQHQSLFAEYKELLAEAMDIAEGWWDGMLEAARDRGLGAADAAKEVSSLVFAGPAARGEVVWTVRTFWLRCVAVNREVEPAMRVPPHVLLLGWLVDDGQDRWVAAWARPCGYAFSSVVDYAKFVQFLYAGNASVLADSERAAMQSPQVNTLDIGGVEADLESYGFGLVVDREFQVGDSAYVTKLVWHNGSLPGFTSWFYLVPSTGFGMVWFANADQVEFATSVALALESFAGIDQPHLIAASGPRGRLESLSKLRRNLRRPERNWLDHGHGKRGNAVDRHPHV